VGREITRLRPVAARFGHGAELNGALTAIAHGDSVAAICGLARLDGGLARVAAGDAAAMRGRANILALREVLAHHATYFDDRPGR
jgi:hypothetical protein